MILLLLAYLGGVLTVMWTPTETAWWAGSACISSSGKAAISRTALSRSNSSIRMCRRTHLLSA